MRTLPVSHFTDSLSQRLAVFPGYNLCQILLVLDHQVEPFAQN